MSDSFAHIGQDTSLTYTCDASADGRHAPIGKAEAPPLCVLNGIDTLEVSYFFDSNCSDIDWEELYLLKLKASEAKRHRWSELSLGTLHLHVMPAGTRLYSIVLNNEHFQIKLGEKMSPNCCVKFSSQSLWQHGPAHLLALIDDWARSISLVPTRPPVVSRVDWAYDFYVPHHDFALDHFVSKAKKDRVWRSDRRDQSYTFGKGGLVIRIYDKVAEIKEQSDKAWFYDLWGRQDYVWRVEFQARREHLKRYGIRTPEDLFAFQHDVLREAASRHTTLRRPGTDSNRSRWPLHPLWAGLVQEIAASPQNGLVRSFDPTNSERHRLYQQLKSLAGDLKGAAALDAIIDGRTEPQELDEFLTRLPDLLESLIDPQDWLDDVQAKMSGHRMGHR